MGGDTDYILACAIDFGTSFSSYAFSFKTDPENIVMNRNWSGGMGYQVNTSTHYILLALKLIFKTLLFLILVLQNSNVGSHGLRWKVC